jgi:hypothetical protein
MMKYLRLLPISVATMLAVGGVGNAQAQSSTGASAISCGSPTQTSGGTANGLISADTPTTDGLRIFPNNTAFNVAVTTNSPNADTVIWSVADANGAIKTQGSFAVKSGVQTATMSCKSTWSGYGSITASLQSNGGTLPNMGTRPMGIATFGVLPNLSSVLGTVTYAHQDQHRFGMQGFNGNIAALHDLGISWTIDDREGLCSAGLATHRGNTRACFHIWDNCTDRKSNFLPCPSKND